jgi:hypothetical protein
MPRMKLPPLWGFGLLLGLWVLHAFLDDPTQKTALLILAMAVALWTAFSLNIPDREPEPERSLLEPPEEGEGEGEEGAEDDPADGNREGDQKAARGSDSGRGS